MEKVRRRLMTLLLSLAVIISYMPMSMITAYAAAGDTPPHAKKLKDNEDGTYTLSLDVTGQSERKPNPVNVIVILDHSGSMDTRTGGWGSQTRMAAAQNAVNNLANSLYSHNTDEFPKMVQMALVGFSTTGSVTQGPTNSYSTFSGAVNGLNADGGTNWEDALQDAAGIDFGDDDPTYVIFVSDGNPTFRNTRGNYNPMDDAFYGYPYYYGVYGNGSDSQAVDGISAATTIGRCYDHAKDDAASLASAVGTDHFYTIGAYGNVSRMQSLTTDAGAPSSNYFSAANTTELQNALETILAEIEKAGIGSVEIEDGTTNKVTTSSGVTSLLEVDTESFKYYRDGVEWTSDPTPPEAKFENGAVQWDLSSLGVLDDNVKYEVRFDCYPSQTTYDYIAQLKNGDIQYSDLDPEVRKYIVDNGNGTYSLRTNTTAALDWDDTRTPDVDEDAKPYTNPEPVRTDSATMSVKKEWENTLDARALGEIDMTVLMDSNEEDPFHEVTLKDPEWSEDNIYISPGIIKDGKVLKNAEGHDFTFAELDPEHYNWELVTPVVHPMLIDGQLTMLTLIDDNFKNEDGADEYTINGKTYFVSGEDGAASLNAYNYRRSNLNLRKDVTGDDKPTGDDRDAFPFTLTVVNGKADDPQSTDTSSDNYVWFSVYDTVDKVTVTDDANVSGVAGGPNTSGYYWAKSGAQITLDMKDGWNLRFTNLPTGTTYTFVEGDLPDGYQFNKSELEDGEDSTFKDGQTTTGTVENTNTSYQVVFTNDYALTDLEITKTWDDSDDQDGMRPTAEEFASMLTLEPAVEGAEPKVVVNEDGTYTITYTDLPRFSNGEEVTYTVTEAEIEGYETEGSPAEDHGTITNTHTPEKTSVTVIKEWDDSDDIGEIRPASIQAQLYAGGEESGDPQTLNEDNDWTYTWENLPKYKNGTEIVYTADETAVPTGYEKSGPEKSTAEDGTVTFTVTNTYNPTSVKKAFKATKTTSGYPAGGKNVTFTFTLTPATGAPGTAQNKELTLSGAKPSGEVNFDEIEFTKPGVFEYTVAETAGTADGWTYATNTYTVTVTVRDDGTGKLIASVDGGDNISFNNEYEPEGTEVTLSGKKTLNGRAMEAGEFSFKLSTKSGEAVETVQNTDTDGNYAFSALTFDTAGTYEYVIEEVNNGRPNVTYDTKKYNVTITVTDDGSGKLSAAISGDVNAQGNNANFTNSYEAAPTSVTFSGIKNISGYPSAGKDVTFTFTLTPGEGAPGSAQTKTVTLNGNTTQGDILFDEIKFDAVGEYKYTIAETKGSTPGWTYSSKVYNVTVKVTDDPDTGSLKAAISGLNEDGSGADFQNTYQAGPASITIVGMKTMVNYGKTLEADKFSFTITGEGKGEEAAEEQTVEEQTTDEQSTDQAADEQPTDQADNEQPTDQADNEQPADQANNEQPADQADNEQPAEGNDTITGAVDRIKGYFTVYALDESTKKVVDIEAPLPDQTTVKNQKGGRVEFGTVEFTRAGTYTYTITESGSMPGVDNDPNPKKTFTVEVTDDGTGTLKAKASPEGEFLFEFKNTYVTPPTPSSVTDQIKITKKLVGHDLEEGFFKFQMLDKSGKVVSTGTNDKDGVVTFAPVTFTEAGNFEYTVQEVDKKSEVIHCDTTPYTVTAEVTNNYDGEKLVVEWDYSGGDSITITNTYSDVVAIDPPVQKIVEGSPDTTETYTFMLEAVTAGAPMPSAAGGASSMTMNITGTGAKEFGVINYTEPGEYTYKVTEVAGSNPDCEYDGSVYTVTAKVTEDPKTYKLSVKTTYTKDGVAVDTAVFKFVNTYPDEPEDSDKPDTGDRNDVAGMLGLMGASAAGLIYMFIRRRREDILG